MFKLLLCSVFIAPCLLLPFTGHSEASSEIETISFDDAYVSPELKKIENCQTAKLDVFFHDMYITTHSADYLAEAIELSRNCEAASFTIVPKLPASSYDEMYERVNQQTIELVETLSVHNVKATITDAEIQSSFDNLTANGRGAIVEITLYNSENS